MLNQFAALELPAAKFSTHRTDRMQPLIMPS
jgi:hypothetical protein